jgi:hypothetical protein
LKFCHFLSALLFASVALAEPPLVRVLDAPTRVEVSAEAPVTLALLGDDGTPGPPILGTTRRDGARYRFLPRFALAAGARYRASAGTEHADFRVADAAAHPSATLDAVQPACAEVPANLLKFYLHFSQPMREGREVFTLMHLLDSHGEEIGAPWRDTELWTEDGKRLTLWIHPGRVKQGVNLRDELGPVLRPGERYTLVVDATLRDATGQPLGHDFRRTFSTTAEVHTRLDLAGWEFHPPHAGTREPLRVVSPVALDHALALRCLHVRGVEGEPALADDERTWSFTPAAAWKAAPHQFAADPWLEDLAGNTFERIFDNDLAAPPDLRTPLTSREFSPQ